MHTRLALSWLFLAGLLAWSEENGNKRELDRHILFVLSLTPTCYGTLRKRKEGETDVTYIE